MRDRFLRLRSILAGGLLVVVCLQVQAAQLNEISYAYTGGSQGSFYELYGASDESLTTMTLIVINASSSNAGRIEEVYSLSGHSFPTGDSYFVIGSQSFLPFAPEIEDLFISYTAPTVMLVEGFTGSDGQDLDTNNDGTLDVTPWTSVVDSIGFSRTGYFAYAPIITEYGSTDRVFFRSPDGAVSWGKGADLETAGAANPTNSGPPTDISISSNTIAENSSDNTYVGTVSATDPDTTHPITIELIDTAGGRFWLDDTLLRADSVPCDYEAATSHTVGLRATDPFGSTYEEDLSILVTDVNEPPTDIQLSANLIAENATTNTLIGTLTTVDADTPDTHTYTLLDDAGGRFAVVGDELRSASQSLLDYEAQSTHSITVQTTDFGGRMFDKALTIQLLNVNEAPTSITTIIPDTIRWTTATASAPWAVREQTFSVVYDDKLWLMGGSSGGGTSYKNDVWYTTNGSIWTQVPASDHWSTRSGSGALVFNGEMWVISGLPGNKTDIWSSSNGEDWVRDALSPGWSGRSEFGTTVFDSKMWMIGSLPTTYGNDVWWSSNGASWTQATSGAAWSDRRGLAAVTYDGKMWIAGGKSTPGNPSDRENDVWWSINGASWTQATANAAWGAREQHGFLVYQDRMWVLPGNGSQDVAYSTDGVNWTSVVSTAPFADLHSYASAVYGDRMWLMGGMEQGADTDAVYFARYGLFVDEMASSGTLIATLGADDEDTTDTHTFALIDDAGGRFQLVGDELRVALGNLIDFETSQTLDVTVRVTDSSSNTLQQIITIPVNDLPEPEADLLDGASPIANGAGPLDFGTALQGDSAPSKTFTVENNGDGDLTPGNLTVPSGYTVTEPLDSFIRPAASDTFTVTLSTATSGTFAGAISFESNDADEDPYSFTVTGTIQTPEIDVTPFGAHDFGSQPVDDGATTPPHFVTITNLGTAPLTFTGAGIAISGADAADFGFATGPSTSALAAGSSRTLELVFDPSAGGARSAQLEITTDDLDEALVTLNLSGTGVSPEVQVLDGVTPVGDGGGPIDFGTVLKDSVGPSRTFTVENTGNAVLDTSNLSVPLGYSVTEGLSASIAAGTSDTFTVELSTVTTGTFAGTVSFNNNDNDEDPFDFTISGTVLSTLYAPTDIGLSANQIEENASTGTLVGTLTTVDADTPDTHTYTLLDDAGGRFAVVGDELRSASQSLLDYEAQSTHSITVQTTDFGGRMFDKALTIQLLNVNEAPTSITTIIPDTIRWTTATASAPWAVREQTFSVVYDDKLWLMGGSSGGGTSYKNDVWYTTNGSIWTQVPASDHWSTRSGSGALVFNGEMWVISGLPGNKTDIWSSSNGEDWVRDALSPGWSGRSEFGTTVFDSKMWMIGSLPTTYGNDVWWSSNGASWTQATSGAAWSDRRGLAAVTYDGKMWIAGGKSTPGNPSDRENDVWWSTNGASWTQATANAAWGAREQHGFLVYQDRMWVLPGNGSQDVAYSTDGVNWTSVVSTAPFADLHSYASAVYGDRMWLMGGMEQGADTDAVYFARYGLFVDEMASSGTLIATLGADDEDTTDTHTFALIDDAGGRFQLVGDELRVALGNLIDFETSQTLDVTVRVTDSSSNTLQQIITIPVNDLPEPEADLLDGASPIANGAGPLDFGTALQGDSAPSKTFTVENNGDGDLTPGNLTVPSGYTVTEPLDSFIRPAASDTFTVTLSTATSGTFAGAISFESNDADEDPYSFTVTGTIQTPEIDVTPFGAHDFGSQPVDDGATTPPHFVTITNLGTAPLTFTGAGVAITGADAADFGFATGPSTSALAAGSSRTLELVFDPSAGGARSAQLEITTDDLDEALVTLNLSGTGVSPEVQVLDGVTPVGDGGGPIDFGTVLKDSVGPSRTFTVENTGNAVLDTSNLSVPLGYSVTEGLSASIAAGTSDTFTVELSTVTTGTFAGTVSFNNNDNDEDPFDFTISGTVLSTLYAPTDIGLSANQIEENASTGTLVGTLTTVDADTPDTHTYTLLDDAGGRFAVVGDELRSASQSLLDYENATTHSLTVRTTDNDGRTFDKNFMIEVLDVNEFPSDIYVAMSNSIHWDTVTTAAAWSVREQPFTVVYDGKLWLMGGRSGGGASYKNDVWVTTNGSDWTLVTTDAQWSTRSGAGALVYDDMMWVIGGLPGAKTDVWWSTDGVTWTRSTVTPGWIGRAEMGHTVFNNKMWILGSRSTGYGNDIWSSSDGVSWSQATSSAAWSDRRALGAVTYDGKMWIAGGKSTPGNPTDRESDVWWSTDGTNWTQATAEASWGDREEHGFHVFHDRMWVLPGNASQDIAYSTDGVNWTSVLQATAPFPQLHSYASAVYNGKFWLMGGNEQGADTHAVYSSAFELVVDELASSGTLVGILATTDFDTSETHTYTLLDDAGGRFQLVGDELRVALGALIDYETSATLEVTVRTTDSADQSYDETLTITVIDIGEPEADVLQGASPIASGSGPVDFGTVMIGSPAPSITFTVENNGDATLSTSNLSVPGGYSVSEPLAAAIVAAGSDTFTVELSTAALGTFAGTVSFDTNDLDENPYTFTVTGTVSATSPLVWLDFDYTGTELGTPSQPFSTLADALGNVSDSGTVRIYTGTSSETPRITQPVRLEAYDGIVRIGEGGQGEPQSEDASVQPLEGPSRTLDAQQRAAARSWLLYD